MNKASAPDVLDQFSPATRAWFRASFAEPTPAQQGAWKAISDGQHALVVAPTGSGKTLSAFLWALDRIATHPRPADAPRCRVLYISPLKALAVDVERNLQSPLVGIGHAATRLGLLAPQVSVAVRSGDTPPAERRRFARAGADVLITTPESLFLLLTSAAREALAGVETVIIDEIHAVFGTKRGAHLAVSLDRLDALLPQPAQRIGLSATVRPVDEVARFLAGGRPVATVQPASTKEWDLRVVVPVPDMTDPGATAPVTGSTDHEVDHEVEVKSEVEPHVEPVVEDAEAPTTSETGTPPPDDPLDDLPDLEDIDWTLPPDDPTERASVWPHIEARIVDLVAAQTSTLVFANSRRLAERLTSRLNEIWETRVGEAADAGGSTGDSTRRPPAQVMAQSGASTGAPPVLARAHHGSVSRDQRADIEDALKTGRLPAVVATSSLELGIDMGAVDLVVQIESPPSVASGLQRVGRAGHQVGAVSRGVLFPKHRGDLRQTAVVVERMRRGLIEAQKVPTNPLDVLAQQIVAMVAMDEWTVPDLFDLIRRSAPFAALPRGLFEATLDMLAGRYPSEDFADLRPRIVWDRIQDTLTPRRGAQHLAVMSGGTIPDRGLYAVMLATGDGPGRRVGELDEEMVYESRVGDVFTLGTSSWRIEDITHDRVLVTPAPGQLGRLPFWKGDSLGRPAELGAAVGAFTREVAAAAPAKAHERLRAQGLDEYAATNLLDYITGQVEATGQAPDDRTIVIERFRDEIGDWRVVVHSPYGAPVHAPWALCISARMRERYGTDVQAVAGDDGIVLRLPELADVEQLDRDLADLLVLDPDDVHDLVTTEIGGSALFAARFRECAARALLLPRKRPDRRQPLWQQRQRSAQLLEVASQFPSFPIVLEAVRECIQDVYDVGALTTLMRDVASRRIRVVTVETRSASPFARSLLMGYVAQYLYEGDSPLAERRSAALSLDPTLLAELLGRGEGAALRDLLDPEVVARTEAELQRLVPERAARDPEDILDLLRTLGPQSVDEIVERTSPEVRHNVPDWLATLSAQRQVCQVRVAGDDRWADAQDAGRLRDALGVAVPPGLPSAFLEPVNDPLADLINRWSRTHTPYRPATLAARLGVGSAVLRDAARRLIASGRLVEGALRPLTAGEAGELDDQSEADLCDADVLRMLRRRSLAALRQEVEPVTQQTYARFLPAWQSIGGLRGIDGVHRAVEQLAGARLPASGLESLILPSRVRDYTPAMLDELMSSGEVLWQGHGPLPGDDGWISLHLADTAPLTMALPGGDFSMQADPPAGADTSSEDSHPAGGNHLGEGNHSSEAERASTPSAEVLNLLAGGGAYFFRALADSLGRTDDSALLDEVWSLVWGGRVTGDTLTPIRALLSGGRGAHRQRQSGARSSRWSRGAVALGGAAGRSGLVSRPGRAPLPTRSGPATGVGRWSALPEVVGDPTARALATAEQLLDRYGVLTRGSVVAEAVPGGFAGIYRVLATAEEAGRVRRGYFVEHLGAAQFGSTGAVDRLRALGADDDTVVVLAATDPASPFGASVPWPERGEESHRPGRKAGAIVVTVGGQLMVYLERGGRTALTYTQDSDSAALAARALADQVRSGHLGSLTVGKIDGAAALSSDHPLGAALQEAGFHTAPQGLRLRR